LRGRGTACELTRLGGRGRESPTKKRTWGGGSGGGRTGDGGRRTRETGGVGQYGEGKYVLGRGLRLNGSEGRGKGVEKTDKKDLSPLPATKTSGRVTWEREERKGMRGLGSRGKQRKKKKLLIMRDWKDKGTTRGGEKKLGEKGLRTKGRKDLWGKSPQNGRGGRLQEVA